MRSGVRAVLFDLDGTIIDSIDGILQSFRHALGRLLPHKTFTREELVHTIGEPLQVQMLGFADGDAGLAALLVEAYREHNQTLLAGYQLYPGVLETLATLARRGFRLGVVTSKYRTSAMVSLDARDLTRRFELIMTADDTQKHKPDPMPLVEAARRLGLAPAEILYVGDSVYDVRCAHGAGCSAAAALWGPFDPNELAGLKPRYLVPSFSALTELDALSE
jgi:pyrophosphatase PpaX